MGSIGAVFLSESRFGGYEVNLPVMGNLWGVRDMCLLRMDV